MLNYVLTLLTVGVYSGLEGSSQPRAAKMEKHRCADHQNHGADEEDAGVRHPAAAGRPVQAGELCW